MPAFNGHLGFEITESSDGHVAIMVDVKPEHVNHSGISHGGFISSLLDAATAMAGTFTANPDEVRKALTLSLNINFLGQAKTKRLKAIGKRTASGRKIYYGAAQVFDSDENSLAYALDVFRYRTRSGIPLAY